MALPRVRFTIRQLMIAVAGVALILAIIRIETARSQWYLDCTLRSLDHRLAAMSYSGSRGWSCWAPLVPPPTVRNPTRAAYHAAMARKWAVAAEHPWFPVAPDPPEPDW
jgi:hypothetical protein